MSKLHKHNLCHIKKCIIRICDNLCTEIIWSYIFWNSVIPNRQDTKIQCISHDVLLLPVIMHLVNRCFCVHMKLPEMNPFLNQLAEVVQCHEASSHHHYLRPSLNQLCEPDLRNIMHRICVRHVILGCFVYQRKLHFLHFTLSYLCCFFFSDSQTLLP